LRRRTRSNPQLGDWYRYHLRIDKAFLALPADTAEGGVGARVLAGEKAAGPIVKDLGVAVAAVWAVYEATLQDAFVMERTLEQATTELADIDLG